MCRAGAKHVGPYVQIVGGGRTALIKGAPPPMWNNGGPVRNSFIYFENCTVIIINLHFGAPPPRALGALRAVRVLRVRSAGADNVYLNFHGNSNKMLNINMLSYSSENNIFMT